MSTIQSRQRQARKNTFGVGKLFVSVPVKKAYTLQQQAITFLSLFKNPKWVDQYVSELGKFQFLSITPKFSCKLKYK